MASTVESVWSDPFKGRSREVRIIIKTTRVPDRPEVELMLDLKPIVDAYIEDGIKARREDAKP